MDKNSYEEKIRALEAEIKIMKERYQILVETTSAILFEYKPAEDKMIFNYNFPENKSRREIDSYHEYMKHSPLVHPDHLKKFMDVLDTASQISIRGDLEYLSKVSSEEFEWHKTYYSSIADASGKIISVFGRICNIHKSATERQKIIHRVETDYLTGLYNRGAATEKITEWLTSNPTSEAHMLMIDLDNFKNINDKYGHAFGDEVLKGTAVILSNCFDQDCIVSRFGGDEFVIFVQSKPLHLVETLADTLIQMLPDKISGLERPLKCSIGISSRISRQDN
ncbi:MAG: GGDEF domain-containing protein, partial [Eubacterium sp.]|nr:GGDEF domain-containing protein [Eubacterium sp.]